MQSILQDHLKVHATGGAHGSHHVYWIPLAVFNQLPVTPWKFNRPPDADRVAEIRSFMQESKRADGLIYLACINHQLVCYESNHRRLALKEGMPADMAAILVDMVWSASDEMIKQEFFRLNKAISVPDLYVDDSGEESADSVIRTITTFCETYPKLKSPSGRPNRPNYNRDIFTQDFLRVMKELRISSTELLGRLTRLNEVLAARDHGRLTVNVVSKCRESGLWLFAWSPTLNSEVLATM